MSLEGIAVIVLILVNIPVYRFLFRLFFVDEEDYDKSVKYVFTPNLLSLFRGEYFKDRMATARLKFYIFLCAIVVILEYLLLDKAMDYFR